MGTDTAAADLVLKAACEGCGGASELYATSCRHATLCRSCGADRGRSRARCSVCAAPITNLIREYNVRVGSTADKALSIGRFTTGLPPFSKTVAENKWSLHKDSLQGREFPSKMKLLEKDYNRKPWILEDETGEYQYQSQLEGSQPATATYYLLMMQGNDFHAFPVGSWYNFSKIVQYKQLTLEEAEEKMNKRRNNATGYERWMMKSATHGAAAFSSDVKKLDGINGEAKGGVQSKKGNKNEDGNQPEIGDDEEQVGAAGTNRHGLTTEGMEDEEEGGKEDFDLNDEIEKGDDWEHEDFFSDDDETMDIDPEQRADLADTEKPPEIKQDDNENEQGPGGLSKSGKELKKLLRRADGQDESSSDDDDNNNEDTNEDELPSPVLAPKVNDEFETEPGENSPAKPTATELANGTPLASRSSQKRRSGVDGAKTRNIAAPKKPKIEAETKTLRVKEEPLSSLEPVSKVIASATIDTNASTITEEEIRRVLRAVVPIPMQDFVSRFKPRLNTQEEKKRFADILKKFCYVDKSNGHNYIYLREEHK